MVLDFLSLYKECAGQPWSMFDNDPDNVEDFESGMKISINKAISTIWNLKPWIFRKDTYTIKLKQGINSYEIPNGTICSKVVSGKKRYDIKISNKKLGYIEDYEDMEELLTGKPENFYVEDETIYFDKIPDKSYEVTIKYLLNPFGLNSKKKKIYELENNDDYINIDEKYEKKFKNCVISLAMMYAIAEETDENYSAYERQYNDSLDVLITSCNTGLNNRKITW